MTDAPKPGGPGAPNPAELMRLTTAYWESQTFLTANRVGLFAALAAGPKEADAVAAECDLSPRHTRLLLRACAALGLLTERDGAFANSPACQVFMVPGSPAYMGDAVRYGDSLYAAWGQLEASVREGRPVLPPSTYLGEDSEATRRFVRSMHSRALAIGTALVSLVDLTGRKTLLDVGGGPGTYSALFCRRYPDLRCQVIDFPGITAVAEDLVREMGAADRVSFLPGDLETTAFPEDRDVVLISGLFHREMPDSCRRMIDRAAACLRPDGMLIVSDVFSDEGGTSPPFAALFGLNMMLSAESGGMHADADVADWMQHAGFTKVDRRPFPPGLPHRVVMGIRDGSA